MTRFSISRPSTSRQLVSFLFALALIASACSGSSEVELSDASAAVDGADQTNADETNTGETDSDESAAGEGGENDSDEVIADAEDDAMGEDDAMVDGDAETAEPTDGEATASSTSDSDLGSAELTAALEAATGDRFSLPFMYLTVDQDCSGCAETVSLYYVPSEAKASILTLETAYVDGVAQSDFSAVDPSLQAGDPRRIAEQLTGTDAAFGIDTVSGAVTSWTLDGNSVTLRCLQVDTRPIDMRTEVCENSIIG